MKLSLVPKVSLFFDNTRSRITLKITGPTNDTVVVGAGIILGEANPCIGKPPSVNGSGASRC